MGKKLTIGVALAIGLAYMLYVPFPDGHDYPWPTRLGAGFANIMEKLGYLNVMLGRSFAAPYRMLDPKMPSNVPGIQVIELELGGVPVKIFRPKDFAKNGPGAAMIYFHGGGWTIASVASYAPAIIKIVNKTGMLVMSPEYRLAPEHPFPAAYDDCLKVTEEFLKKAKYYDVNPKKVVLSGDSAGGNLLVAISLELGLREKNKPNPICMANPLYPLLQIGDFRLPSYLQNTHMPILSRDAVVNFVLNYAGFGSHTELIPMLTSNAHMKGFDEANFRDQISKKWIPQKYKKRPEIDDGDLVRPGEENSPQLSKLRDMAIDRRMAPLMVDDDALKTLPRTHIISCEYDVLRDDAIILHERMKKIGSQVSLDHWEFAIHALISGYGVFHYDKLEEAMDRMLNTILQNVDQC